MNNKKKIIVGSIIGVLIGTLFSVSYAFFTFSKAGGTNSTLVTGNIWMKYGETNTLTLENAMPSDTYDSTHKFEFTIEGANTTTDKDVWYEIIAKRGVVPDGKTEENRLQDKYIKFTLTKQIGNGTIETVVDGESWEGLTSGKKIYVDKIDKNTNSTTHKYVLYMWISNKVGIGTNTTYTISQWNDLFASIKVDVNGDFSEKTADEPYMTVNAMNSLLVGNISPNVPSIKKIFFNRMKEDAMQTAYDNASIKADLTYNNEGKVLAWLEENEDDNTKYNLIVASDGKTYFTTGNGLFAGNAFSNLENIQFNNVDTSRVTNMSSMFFMSPKLVELNLSSFNTSNVTNMFMMFSNCQNLAILDLSSFTTNQLLYGSGASQIFDNSPSLRKIYVSPTRWDLSNQPPLMRIFGNNNLLEGGAGTPFDNSKTGNAMAIIDEGPESEHPGYLTDISLKPAS